MTECPSQDLESCAVIGLVFENLSIGFQVSSIEMLSNDKEMLRYAIKLRERLNKNLGQIRSRACLSCPFYKPQTN